MFASNYGTSRPKMAYCLPTFWGKVYPDPSPESLLQSLRFRVMEPRRDFFPGVALTQHLENLADLAAMVLLNPEFDQFHQ